jgi:hypothetical protein
VIPNTCQPRRNPRIGGTADLSVECRGRSVGLILCKDKNRVVVEYALQDMNTPIGVASFRLPPAELQANLPSPELLASEVHKYEQLTKPKSQDN